MERGRLVDAGARSWEATLAACGRGCSGGAASRFVGAKRARGHLVVFAVVVSVLGTAVLGSAMTGGAAQASVSAGVSLGLCVGASGGSCGGPPILPVADHLVVTPAQADQVVASYPGGVERGQYGCGEQRGRGSSVVSHRRCLHRSGTSQCADVDDHERAGLRADPDDLSSAVPRPGDGIGEHEPCVSCVHEAIRGCALEGRLRDFPRRCRRATSSSARPHRPSPSISNGYARTVTGAAGLSTRTGDPVPHAGRLFATEPQGESPSTFEGLRQLISRALF